MEPKNSPRKCGGCDVCCTRLAAPEIGKRADTPCIHLRRQGGCGIYPIRPPVCSGYLCLWRQGHGLPHAMRPDLCNVVLNPDLPGKRILAVCPPANPTAWRRRPTLRQLIRLRDRNWSEGVGVFPTCGARMWLLAPRGDLDLGEVGARTPIYFELRSDGTAYAEKLPDPAEDVRIEAYAESLRARLAARNAAGMIWGEAPRAA